MLNSWVWPLAARSVFKVSVLTSAVVTILFSAGCASSKAMTQPNNSFSAAQSQYNTGNNSAYLDANSLDALQDLLSATDMRAVESDRLQILKHGDVWKRMTVGFKMDLSHYDPRIDAQRSWFVSRQPYLDRLSARASRYLYHTVKEAERRGMPTELALLPIIESSYDPAATSSAAAAGLWQFIPSTGRIYGLKQTELYDGRRDVVESTRAAYEFLGSLYNQFGSWELALAAYNAGPGTIQKAINRNLAAGLPTDYWSLRLPQETMNYVPRFLAVAQIIKDPKTFGVSLPAIANRPHFREVMVPGGVALEQIASITGLPRAELYALNPAHRGERLAADAQMRLLIPTELNPAIDTQLKALQPSYTALQASTVTTSNNTINASVNASSNTNSVTAVTSRSTPNVTTTNSKSSSSLNPAYNTRSRVSGASNVNSSAQILTPSRSAPPTLSTASGANNLSTTTARSNARAATPRGSSALAAFASSADVPSAPRIPVAINPVTAVQPINTQPALSSTQRQQITAQLKTSGVPSGSVQQILQPQASQAEKDQVVAEIKAIAPTGTEIVDPLDGKIKLTALQTSLSVAEKKGQELSKSFAYPKALAEAETKANSAAAQRNQGKDVIRTATDVVVVPPKGKRSTYTVAAGDTLVSIAAKSAVNWRDIAKWNQIDSEKPLYVGASLYLYDAKLTPNAVPSKSKKPDSYVVKSGDNLSNIAAQFELSVADLAMWNELSNNSRVMVGQKLRLSPSPDMSTSTKKIKTERYSVKRGENLQLLAQRYGLSNAELATLNDGLTASSRLQAGQSIIVPVSSASNVNNTAKSGNAAERTTRSGDRNSAGASTESYKVKRGDTLSSIADKFQLDVATLRDINDLRGHSLDVGQVLKIPAEQFKPDEYTVKSGDTLSSIATRFNVDAAALARQNDLKRSANLQVGQRLRLTGSGSSNNNSSREVEAAADRNTESTSSRKGRQDKTESYTVKSGESWAVIAQRYALSAKALAELNNSRTRDTLQRGQSIVVPKITSDYTIKRGDTLIALANKYGIAETDLAQMNGLKTSSVLRVGDILKVPN